MFYRTEGLPTHLTLRESDHVVIIDQIEDGLIKIPQNTRGKIVGLHNQVSADVWFQQIGRYGGDPVRDALKLNGTYSEHLKGIVMHLPKPKFAVVYSYEEHENIRIREEKAQTIPYFRPISDEMKLPSSWYVGNERGVEYQLGYVKDVCDEEFAAFVKHELKFKKITKREREDRHYPDWADRCLTNSSETTYEEQRSKLESAFAKVTGVFAEFLGGLVFD